MLEVLFLFLNYEGSEQSSKCRDREPVDDLICGMYT